MLFGVAVRNVQIRYFIDHDPDHRKAVFVAGLPRSGTTWVGELINFRNESRYIFEPFDPVRVALAVNFSDHTYLRPDNNDPHFLAPAAAIVTGLIRQPFVDQWNRKVVCGSRVIKEVRASLFLRWLYEHFPGMPLVLIVRHPFAVAASQGKTHVDVDLEKQFLAQPQLVEDYLHSYVDVMRSCVTPFERQVAAWCVGVGVPLSQFSAGEICVVFYEHLCEQPERTLRDIFTHVQRRFDPRVVRRLTEPSSTTISDKQLAFRWAHGPEGITRAWQDLASPQQVRRGLEILGAFGMTDLYDERPMPLVERVELPRLFGRPALEELQRAVT